jgi:hypothetical protein
VHVTRLSMATSVIKEISNAVVTEEFKKQTRYFTPYKMFLFQVIHLATRLVSCLGSTP